MSRVAKDPRPGRRNQRQRTRTALLEAADRLLQRGETPTVAQVADQALVSRATAYRYFPSQEHLLLEAVLKRSVDGLDAAIKDAVDRHETPAARVDALIRTIHEVVSADQRRFRDFMRLSVAEASLDRPDDIAERAAGAESTIATVRGTRRVHWIEYALAPARPDLSEPDFRRLVSALTLCTGAEALVVLTDLAGLPATQVEDTTRWAARALLAASGIDTDPSD
ncbi:MAG: TetR/AcrR family transcriptional regulator [Spirillospora sp.]